MNFLIVAFVALVLGFARRFRDLRAALPGVLAALGLAFVTTVFVNSARIALSVVLAKPAARYLELSFQSAHRYIGVVLYLAALFSLVLIADRLSRASKPTSAGASPRAPFAVALVCYLGVTVAAPLARHAAPEQAAFEHFRAIFAVSAAMAAVFAAVGLVGISLRAARR
jgi:exosortase/archaeosortase family protein